MPAQIRLFRCLSDNYGVLLHDPATGATASIDAPEAAPVEAALKDSYVEDVCGNAEAAALLDFWNRMLDRFAGERDD